MRHNELTVEEKGELEELQKDMQKETQECKPCNVAVAFGMVIDVCNRVKEKKLDCKDFEKKFYEGKITLRDLVQEIEPHTENDSQKYIVEFLKTQEDILGETGASLE